MNEHPQEDSDALRVAENYAAKGATAPRITLDYMKSQIAETIYTSPDANMMVKDQRRLPQLGAMTLCVLVLKSGFVVMGKSAPMSLANYDREKGQTFAYEDAVRQLWPMFAFHQLQAKWDVRND